MSTTFGPAAEATLLERARASAEPADRSSREILDAAFSTFLDFGVRRSTMNEIARRAAVGVATVYRRYPQKDELIEAVVLREVRRFIEQVDERVRSAEGVTAQVVEGFVAFATGVGEHPLVRSLIATEPEVVLPVFTVDGGPLLAMGRGYLADNIRRLQREGKLDRFAVEPVAEILARLLHSLLLTPEGCIPHDNEDAAREFAGKYIVPLLTRAHPTE